MSLFDTIFHAGLDVAGGIYGEVANEGLNLLKGGKHDTAIGAVEDVGGELANAKTEGIATKDTDVLNSAEADAAATAASAGVEQNKKVQTAVNTGYDIAQAGAGLGNAASTLARAGAAAAPALATDGGTSVSAEAPEEIGKDAAEAAANPSAALPPSEPPQDVAADAGTSVPAESPTSAGPSAATKLKLASAAANLSNKTYQGVTATAKSFQKAPPEIEEPEPEEPSSARRKTITPQAEDSLVPKNSYFDTVFGPTLGVAGTPNLLNPNNSQSALDPLSAGLTAQAAPGQLQAPSLAAAPNRAQPVAPAMLSPQEAAVENVPLITQNELNQGQYTAVSDRNQKTNVKAADRSLKNFLKQIHGRI